MSAKKPRFQQGSSKKPPVEKGRWAAKGTKPLPEQATVKQILSLIIVHGCRKVLFIETEVKVTLYSIALFFGSLVFDFLPFPATYLSSRENIFYLYFVRIGWLWAMLFIVLFIYMTTSVYSCGHSEVMKRNFMRPFIATIFWYFWSQWFFTKIETMTGACLGKAIYKSKQLCNDGGFHWHAFDISGPAFLLVYVNLVLVEEAKAIIGWEGIKDLIRIEEHKRITISDQSEESSALSKLSHEELFHLKDNYEYFTPFIRTVFFFMTAVSLLSDVMIAVLVIYFHTMPQKVAGGLIAIATWYFTYRFWFKRTTAPGLPGTGILFNYQEFDRKIYTDRRRSSIKANTESRQPNMFMGMPIYQKDIGRRNIIDLSESLHKYERNADFFCQEPRRRFGN